MDLFYIKMFFAALCSCAMTCELIPFFILIARRFGIMDYPNNTVKTHKQPTPYLGGAAVYFGFFSLLGIFFSFNNQFFIFWIGLTILFCLGLIDDLRPITPLQKFIGQSLAVACFLKGGIYLKSHFLCDIYTIALSAFWMVFVINAFNLIDIMDGLATLVALCAASTYLMVALLGNEYSIALLLSIFIGVLVAFFKFNAPPARIYLGDAGSLFIGGIFAVTPFLLNWGSFTPFGFLAPIIITAIPLLEVTTLILVRTYNGVPFYRPSADHFAIKLKKKGIATEKILLFVIGASIILAVAVALFILERINMLHLVVMGATFLVFWIYCIFS